MGKNFHSKKFDDGTIIKLDIFRKYIRKWLPTFMTKYSDGKRNFKKIKIYDFFSGPGYDADCNPGSPIIIVEEIKNYCQENESLKANIEVEMFFNDIDGENIKLLKKNISNVSCKKPCCHIRYSIEKFTEVFQNLLPEIQDSDSAKLIIMDQFGVKDVTPEIVSVLSKCQFTDILFFISSSFVYRFKDELGCSKLQIDQNELKDVEYNYIHRFICEYFSSKLDNQNYYLSPFSIKKDRNIYGVIFGSRHLLGLEKFVESCWEIDPVNGESNYNINGDISWDGQKSLFPEANIISKVDVFEKELIEFIATNKPDNKRLYEFCLRKGFSAKKAKESLEKLQDCGKIKLKNTKEEKIVRKGSFYLKDKDSKVTFISESNS